MRVAQAVHAIVTCEEGDAAVAQRALAVEEHDRPGLHADVAQGLAHAGFPACVSRDALPREAQEAERRERKET